MNQRLTNSIFFYHCSSDCCRIMIRHSAANNSSNRSSEEGVVSNDSKAAAPVPTSADREQALRDYKLTIEYKSLKQNAPGGVFLIPSLEDMRIFHGFILIRRGLYANGIFKFQLQVPPNYNDKNTWPQITFATFVYNPLVDPVTWKLDVKSAFPTWSPQNHYLVTILTFLKKIFYTKDWSSSSAFNLEAKALAIQNPNLYRKMVDQCVAQSQETMFDNFKGSTAIIKEDQPVYATFRYLLKSKVHDAGSVSRNALIDLIEEAKTNSEASES